MSNLRLYCEPKPDYYYFQNQIIERLKADRYNWITIFPVNRAVRIFTRTLIPHAKNKILAAPKVFTFDNILLDIYKSLPRSKTVINNELLIFLVEEVLKKLAPDFTFLPNNPSPPARLIQKISKIIAELRRFGYNAGELSAKDAQEINIPNEKLSDFTLILKEIESLLGDRYIDLPAARHEAAINVNQHIFQKLYPEISEIFISGYGLFTPAMYLFIENVTAFCTVSVKLEFTKENLTLFENTNAAYERFLLMGAQIFESEKKEPLALKLFNRERKAGTYDLSEKITAILCENSDLEIRHIAQRIYTLKQQNHVPLDQIAITFNPIEKYVPIINRVFSEYNIPFNLSTGYPLKQSPLTGALLNCVDLIYENFEYGRVYNIYMSPFYKSDQDYSSVFLFKSIIKGRIRYLTKDWDSKLQQNLNIKGDKISDTLTKQIRKLNTFLFPFYNFGNKKRSADRFKMDYLRLLKESGLFEWYRHNNPSLNERQREREFRAFNKFIKILDQFSWSMQIVFGDNDIDLKTWLSHLKSAINRSVYNLTEWPVEAVQIMPRLEIQAVDYDYLFIGGLVDGNFPRSSTADIFLNDENRQKMGLLANEDLLSQDRFIFYSLLNSAKKKTFLTIPHYSGEKTLVQSSFIDDLKECCTIKSETSDGEILHSKDTLWEEFGLSIQQNNILLSGKIKSTLAGYQSPETISTILQKIKAQNTRLSLFQEAGSYEGNLSHNKSVHTFIANTYKEHYWSITQLEDYAFCPMQYFLKRVLRLEEMPEFDDEVSPLERGNTVHNILFNFYTELRKRKVLTHPEHQLDVLQEITERELSRLPFDGFFWQLEKMRFFGRGENPGLLKTFLELEKSEIEKTGFIPAHFEFSFGPSYSKEKDPQSTEKLLNISNEQGQSIKINGKIDRIDINPKMNYAAVYDYKTGSIDGKNAQAVARGLSFQLPLYISAVEQLLNQHPEAVYGGYYQVKDSVNCKRDAAMADPDKYPFLKKNARGRLPNSRVKINDEKVGLTELIEHSKKIAIQKQQQLLQAKFTHTQDPNDKRCSNFCDYKRMCQKYVSKLKYQAEHKEKSKMTDED